MSLASDAPPLAVIGAGMWAAPSPWPWITPGFPWCCSIRDRPRGPRAILVGEWPLAPDVLAFLAGLGVEVPQTPYEHMTVWDHSGPTALHFSAAEVGLPRLGAMVENDRLRWALTQTLGARGVPLRWGAPGGPGSLAKPWGGPRS